MYINLLITRNYKHETRQKQSGPEAQLHDRKGVFGGFWLLPQWLGFRVDTSGTARWRWLAALPSVPLRRSLRHNA
jgi:hypothetical protein